MAKQGNGADDEKALDDAAERLRELNERIIAAGKTSGKAYLEAYEANLRTIAEHQSRLSTQSCDVEWVSTLLKAQADYTRELANAVATHGQDLLK